MEYKITNIIKEDDKIRVFYSFSNGQENSNLFNATDSIIEINQWAEDRIKFFEEQQIAIDTCLDNIIIEAYDDSNNQ